MSAAQLENLVSVVFAKWLNIILSYLRLKSIVFSKNAAFLPFGKR